MKNFPLYVWVVLVVVSLMMLYKMRAAAPGAAPMNGALHTVLGTDWCGFTTKQREQLDKKYGAHEYVNCEDKTNAGACAGVTGFPVTITPTGARVEGYNPNL